MTHIVFVGHAVWDHIFMVPRLTAEPGKFVASRYGSRPGGMSTNAAMAAQQLRGADSPAVHLAAPMGDDESGQALLHALGHAGVHVLPACVLAGRRSSVSAVLVDQAGERQGHNVRGDAQAYAPLPDAALLAGAVGLQVDPRWPAGARRALELARQAGVPSLLDGDVAPTHTLRELAPLADWVVFSSDGLRAWSGISDHPLEDGFSRACAELPHTQLAVTLGPQGLWWRAPGAAIQAWPAYPVLAVNTNGAGDALHGALLLALAENLPPAQALRFGMAAAALTCAGQPLDRNAAQALARTTA